LVAKEATGSRDRGRRRRDRWGGWPINYGGYRGTLNHLELRRYRWDAYNIRLAAEPTKRRPAPHVARQLLPERAWRCGQERIQTGNGLACARSAGASVGWEGVDRFLPPSSTASAAPTCGQSFPKFFLSQFGLIAAMHRLIDFLVGSGGYGVKKRARSEFSARRFLFSWSPSASYPALCRSYHHKEMCFQSAAIAFHIITRYRFMLSGLFICNFSWLGGVTGFFPLPSCGLIACHMNASC
jgi:hypothetical protein